MPRRRASKGHVPPAKRKSNKSAPRWNRREDIPLEDVDEFQEQRDKILLDGENDEIDDDGNEEEVFGLNGFGDLSDETEDDDDEEETAHTYDESDDGSSSSVETPKSKLKRSTKVGKKNAPPSESSSSSDEQEDEESWGAKKSAYYSSNAAQLDSDDEEAHEMEEQEARRLQAKQREAMREEDFGYIEALQRSSELKATDDIWEPAVQPKANPIGTDKKSILKHLEKHNPEALALAYDWDDIAHSLSRIRRKIREIKDPKGLGLIHIHYQTLLTYAAVLAFYLHLRAAQKYAQNPDLLREHPIMNRLVTLKQGLQTFDDLDFTLSDSDSDLDDFDSDELDLGDEDTHRGAGGKEEAALMKQLGSMLGSKKAAKVDIGELMALLSESELSKGKTLEKKASVAKKAPAPRKTKKKDTTNGVNGVSRPTVKFDLEEPTVLDPGPSKLSYSSKAHKPSYKDEHTFGLGEATSLDDADLVDKGARKKALRFHTQKIESASQRRQNARGALGGDDDVPYRERRKEREAREAKAKAKRELGAGGDDLDEEDDVMGGKKGKRGRDEEEESGSGSDEGEDGYYSLVKKQKKAKKAEKKARYEEQKEATRVEYDDETTSGQRSITRAILKNKGLTPRRSKSVRNPRVKKRQRFEKAKKKLASQKAVYKGGIGEAGHYGGEATGISKVVKSVQL